MNLILGADIVDQTAHHAVMPTAFDKAVSQMQSRMGAADAKPYRNQVPAFLADFVSVAKNLGRAPAYRSIGGVSGYLRTDAGFLSALGERGWAAPGKAFLAKAYDDSRASLQQPMLDPARYARENPGVNSSVMDEVDALIKIPGKVLKKGVQTAVDAATGAAAPVVKPLLTTSLVMGGLIAFLFLRKKGK